MTISKLTRLARHSCLLAAIFLFYNSCGPKIYYAGPFKDMTITLSGLFAQCHNPQSSSAPIPFKGTVQIYYFDERGQNKRAGDYKSFTSAANTATPVTVTVQVPEKNFFTYDIIVQGTACSTCAPTQVGLWTCIQAGVTGGITAARPQWEWDSGIVTNHPSSLSMGGTGWMQYAVANSCGCVVPY